MNTGAMPGTKCGIAAHRGFDVECPDGGCALLMALGLQPVTDPGETCPVEQIALDAGYDPSVVWTLDELRRELEGRGLALASTRAVRSRDARHASALRRWPEER